MDKANTNDNDTPARHLSEMQDIINAVPSRLIRWGITVFFFVLILMIALADFIHYPDIIKTSLVVRSANSAGSIVCKTPGKLIQLLTEPGQQVNAGQPVARIEGLNSEELILKAPVGGKLTYSSILHEQETLTPGQHLFDIEQNNAKFFGEMVVAQGDLGKVSQGQQVLIRLAAYPFEQFGVLKGKIKYISTVTNRENAFLAEVNIELSKADTTKGIQLKDGMQAEAEVVVQDASILQRISRNTFKSFSPK